MKKLEQSLHCGACMTNFNDPNELNDHLKECPAAIVMLPFIHQVWNGNDSIGHPVSHMITALNQNAGLIKKYINIVINMGDILKRAELHTKLCKELDIDYKDFRPFESEKIKEIPTFEEAQIIFWQAIAEQLIKKLIKKLKRIKE